jgi:formamidopyrimidine-DNA glycosylase
MPELPEVETVRRGLEPYLDGATFVAVEARRPDLRFPLPPNFAGRLTGARVARLTRRGKYMLAALDRGETLLIHLGMTGRFGVELASGARRPGAFALAAPAAQKHAHIVFETSAGARLTYYDARRFGFMDLIDSARIALLPPFAAMGPEPLEDAFDAAHLARAFAGRRQGPKTLLLDQSIVAGLGNIYVCEALHRARISPLRAASAIRPARLEGLAAAVRAVLAEAIAAGGSTLRDFAHVAGGPGYFQHGFQAYGRAGEACGALECSGRIRRIVQSGRSTFYCPRCQR